MTDEIKTTTRTTRFTGETLALFTHLAADRPDTLIFESPIEAGRRAEKSLIFPRNAVRIEGRGGEVACHALTPGGKRALKIIERGLGKIARTKRKGEILTALFPEPARSGTDSERLAAGCTADALRIACEDLAFGSDEPLIMPGVFAYDYVERFEALPEASRDDLGFPDFVFWVPETTVVVHNADGTARIVHRSFDGTEGADEIEKAIEEARDISVRPRTHKKGTPCAHSVDMSDSQFATLVARLKEHISAGDVFQIVPSRTFSAPCPDPVAAYRELKRGNPSPYMFLVRGGDFTLFGSSPEACVRVLGRPRRVEIHPIAGTRSRGMAACGAIDSDLDDRLEADLRLNEKEMAEHMMLVDLARNDVARISRTGTRSVRELCSIEKYSHVMHLVSFVEGELKEDLDAIRAYVACMNMGTLVGAPKIEAAKLLRKHELSRRGPYGGAVGYITSEGELETAIVIRSALVVGGTAHVRAGAGIVHDSDPAAEARETEDKARAVLGAIARASGGEE